MQVYVRMYRALEPSTTEPRSYKGLLGDCFLIRLEQQRKKSHILIDCGLLLGSPEAQDRANRIAANIIQETGGTLDLLVVTHEHWDHISGFSQARDLFLNPAKLKIANLWMAWTEKVGDSQADKLRAKFDKSNTAFAAFAEHLQKSTGLNGSQILQGLDAFIGLAPGAGRMTGREIMDAVKAAAQEKSFLEPGTVIQTPTATPGGPTVRAFALGPPRDEKLLFKDSPSGGAAQETYLDLPTFGNAMLRVTQGETDVPNSDIPFAQHFCKIEAKYLKPGGPPRPNGEMSTADEIWIGEHYFKLPAATSAQQAVLDRRQIDNDWLSAAGPLALKLDSDTNNTSLVLAFDLPDGTAMLFAADAQVGNWLSWHTHDYVDETGKTHKAEQILNRTRFYKVGHHGSHNATLDKQGLAMMTRDDLVAAIPTDEELGKKQGGGWQMPNPRVKAVLLERTKGRIMRNDRFYDPAARSADPELKDVDPAFFAKLTEDDLYLEFRVL
jgi:beta-lactamase superfamily II metal-dependent hydrolase